MIHRDPLKEPPLTLKMILTRQPGTAHAGRCRASSSRASRRRRRVQGHMQAAVQAVRGAPHRTRPRAWAAGAASTAHSWTWTLPPVAQVLVAVAAACGLRGEATQTPRTHMPSHLMLSTQGGTWSVMSSACWCVRDTLKRTPMTPQPCSCSERTRCSPWPRSAACPLMVVRSGWRSALRSLSPPAGWALELLHKQALKPVLPSSSSSGMKNLMMMQYEGM
mmetsp:Transcript_27181/g.59347  ORF Transcript_27181/g.59347 Transcript_27181/m.59347 type:complete len:220 (-) Transcript_27181:976-1635(-)